MTLPPQRCSAVGTHSLLLDHRQGTDDELHTFQADLDSHLAIRRPAQFRATLQSAMMEFDVPTVWVILTLKGVHLASPHVARRFKTERFEGRFMEWGADTTHGTASYRNGGSVLRATPKPGEGDGPRAWFTMHVEPPLVRPRPWSLQYAHFWMGLHPTLELPRTGDMVKARGLRLESYESWYSPEASVRFAKACKSISKA